MFWAGLGLSVPLGLSVNGITLAHHCQALVSQGTSASPKALWWQELWSAADQICFHPSIPRTDTDRPPPVTLVESPPQLILLDMGGQTQSLPRELSV